MHASRRMTRASAHFSNDRDHFSLLLFFSLPTCSRRFFRPSISKRMHLIFIDMFSFIGASMINTAINLSIRTRCYVQSENIRAVILRRDAHNNYWWLVISVSKLRSTSSFRLVDGLDDRFTVLQRRGFPSNKTSLSSKIFLIRRKILQVWITGISHYTASPPLRRSNH